MARAPGTVDDRDDARSNVSGGDTTTEGAADATADSSSVIESAADATAESSSVIESAADVIADSPSTSFVEGADPCESNGTSVNHRPDGGCDQAQAFGTCNGNIFEVDCLCVDGHGTCTCMSNQVQVGTVSYDCTACDAVGGSWVACGFPPL